MLTLEQITEFKTEPERHFNFVDKEGLTFDNGVEVLFFAGFCDNGRSRWACRCFCGNYFLARSSNLTPSNNRSSCGCFRKRRKLAKSVEERTKIAEDATGYTVIDHGPDGYAVDKWTFRCQFGHEFSTKWVKVVAEGTKCPYCSPWGFLRIAPGHFYINSVRNHEDKIIAYKYGITNSSTDKRLNAVARRSVYNLKNEFMIFFESGDYAVRLEKAFSEHFGKKYLTKAEMPDGYTETVKPVDLYVYLDWVSNYIKENKFDIKDINN